MIEVESYTRKWGNSLGIVIPREIVEQEGISENEKIVVGIERKPKAGEFFGMFAGWKRPTEEIKRRMKEGWD